METTTRRSESGCWHHFDVFGRDGSSQSRAFIQFIYHLYDNFFYLVRGNAKWWYDNNFFESSARAIGEKLNVDGPENAVSHFIDCNCLETERVGGGPAKCSAVGSPHPTCILQFWLSLLAQKWPDPVEGECSMSTSYPYMHRWMLLQLSVVYICIYSFIQVYHS